MIIVWDMQQQGYWQALFEWGNDAAAAGGAAPVAQVQSPLMLNDCGRLMNP